MTMGQSMISLVYYNFRCSRILCCGYNQHLMHVQAAPSAERESLYEDFMKEKEKKEREAKKAERKRRMAAFWELLENTKSIKVREYPSSDRCRSCFSSVGKHSCCIRLVSDHDEMGSAHSCTDHFANACQISLAA